jgi:hypothetical protein
MINVDYIVVMSMQMHQQDHQALPSGAVLPDDRPKLDEAYKETNLKLFVRPCNLHVFHLLVYAGSSDK